MGKYPASFPNFLHCAKPLIKTPAGNNGKFLGEMVKAKEHFQSTSQEFFSFQHQFPNLFLFSVH